MKEAGCDSEGGKGARKRRGGARERGEALGPSTCK